MQRQLETRIDDLESRIGELPTPEDIRPPERQASRLDQRVEDLEQTETTTQTQTETSPR